jgi:hypothetical protein
MRVAEMGALFRVTTARRAFGPAAELVLRPGEHIIAASGARWPLTTPASMAMAELVTGAHAGMAMAVDTGVAAAADTGAATVMGAGRVAGDTLLAAADTADAAVVRMAGVPAAAPAEIAAAAARAECP